MFVAIGILVGLVAGASRSRWSRCSGADLARRGAEGPRRVLEEAERDAETTRREAQIEAREDGSPAARGGRARAEGPPREPGQVEERAARARKRRSSGG